MDSKFFRLLAVEGPAGCGKTTLIRQFTDQGALEVLSPLPLVRPRNYGPEACFLSNLKDQLRAAEAAKIMVQSDENSLLLIDRYCLSQLVYETLREGSNEIPEDVIYAAHTTALASISINLESLCWRMLNKDLDIAFDLKFLILTPEISEIERRRALGGKEYPFDPVKETMLYHQISFALHDHVYPVFDWKTGTTLSGDERMNEWISTSIW